MILRAAFGMHCRGEFIPPKNVLYASEFAPTEASHKVFRMNILRR